MITTEWDRCQAAMAGSVDDAEHPMTLYPITAVTSIRSWDYSMPTLTKPRRFTDRRTFSSLNGNDDFLEVIKNHNHGLTYLILDAIGVFQNQTDIVLYGGALLDIILKKENSIKDWDMRLIGNNYMGNEALCIERARSFVAAIFAILREENTRTKAQNETLIKQGKSHEVKPLVKIHEVQSLRRNRTITINVPSYGKYAALSFQFTFEPYSNVEQLLAVCTPHCCRIVIQDKTVWVDQAARYCIESLCFVATPELIGSLVIDNEDNDDEEEEDEEENEEDEEENEEEENQEEDDDSASQTDDVQLSLYRLKKLFDKGFDIVLPDLDIQKIPKRNLKFDVCEVLDLPFIFIIYDSVNANKIMVQNMKFLEHDYGIVNHGYDDDEEDVPRPVKIGETVHHNVRCLVHHAYDKFMYAAEGEEYEHALFDPIPQITPRMIDKTYETVYEKLVDDETNIIDTVQRYFHATSPPDIIEELYVKPLRSNRTMNKLPTNFDLDTELLESLIEKEKKDLIDVTLAALPENIKELCGGSLTPVTEATSEIPDAASLRKAFYGKYQLDP